MTLRKIKLKGDSKKQDKGVALTNGLHSFGEVIVLSPFSISNQTWSCSFIAKIIDSKGISDVDGKGGDGIKMKFVSKNKQELFAVSLDTYKNLENNSGNEIVVYFEGTKVAQAACKIRFNDGKEKKIKVVYNNKLQTVVVSVNGIAVVAYAFHDIPFYNLIKEPFFLSFSSFTGDAGGTHIVSDIVFNKHD